MNIILLREDERGRPLAGRDPRAAHLRGVLRKTEGGAFRAGIVGGLVGTARVTGVGADGSISFSLEALEEPPPKLPLRLAAGFPRPIQLRRLLRDITAFGVARIDLLESDLGDPNYRKTALLEDGGADAALLEGLSQARDTVPPRLCRYSGADAWLASAGAAGGATLRAVCDNAEPEADFASVSGPFDAALLAVGPERGWSGRERALFKEAGFLRLSFGLRPLRVENACLVACALAARLMNK